MAFGITEELNRFTKNPQKKKKQTEQWNTSFSLEKSNSSFLLKFVRFFVENFFPYCQILLLVSTPAWRFLQRQKLPGSIRVFTYRLGLMISVPIFRRQNREDYILHCSWVCPQPISLSLGGHRNMLKWQNLPYHYHYHKSPTQHFLLFQSLKLVVKFPSHSPLQVSSPAPGNWTKEGRPFRVGSRQSELNKCRRVHPTWNWYRL